MPLRFKISSDGQISRTLTVDTLAENAKHNSHRFWCDDCGRGRDIDLAAMIERYGPDYPMARFRRQLVCRSCGSKNVRLVASYTGPGSGRRVDSSA